MHGGLLHLLGNMYFLWIIGLVLKQQVLKCNPLLQLLQRPEANIIR